MKETYIQVTIKTLLSNLEHVTITKMEIARFLILCDIPEATGKNTNRVI